MVRVIKNVLIATVLLSTPLVAAAQSQSSFSVGESQFCTLQDDGQVACTLSPGFDRLAPPEGLPALIAVTAGDAHACGITFEGQPICWGGNFFGQLNAPVVDLPLVQINAGQNHTCAIDSAGAATCWGLNSNAQLEPPENALFTKVDAAFTSSCGILSNGDITCWSTDRERAPELLTGPFVDLDIVNAGVCGLVADGSIRCSSVVAPIPQQNGPYTDFAATQDATCALGTDGILECEVSRSGDPAAYPVGDQFVSIQSVETGFNGIGASFERNTQFGTTMCGERFDGSFTCWAQSTRFPALDEPIPSQAEFISAQRLDLDARVYGASAVEIFWTPIRNPAGATPQVDVFRNGQLLLTTSASFSYFDAEALEENTYQIRLIGDAGNIGTLSDPLSVNTQTRTVLFNGEPTLTSPVLEEDLGQQTIITDFVTQTVFGAFLVSWDVDPTFMSSVDGFELRINGQSVGFTRSQLYLNTDMQLGQRCFEVLAVDAAGTVLDNASPLGREC